MTLAYEISRVASQLTREVAGYQVTVVVRSERGGEPVKSKFFRSKSQLRKGTLMMWEDVPGTKATVQLTTTRHGSTKEVEVHATP